MGGDPPTLIHLELLFIYVLRAALGFGAIALFVMLLIGGFRFLTSGGDSKLAEGAQKTITYAIGGLVLILVSFILLILIRQITGVDVTSFRVSTN